MSTYFNQCFNFLPINTGSQNTSYTVPIGRFSIATVFFDFIGRVGSTSYSQRNIYLNGVSILKDDFFLGYVSTNTTITAPFSCIAYTNEKGEDSGRSETTASITNASGGNAIFNGVIAPKVLKLILKAGDTISGTDFRITYTEFNSNNTTSGFKGFNYEPTSNVVASSAYTIPAGKYARVIHYHDAFLVLNTYDGMRQVKYPSTNTSHLLLNGSILRKADNEVPYNFNYYYDDKGGTYITEDFTKSTKISSKKYIEYYAKSGDVISGSGSWKAIISIYDNLN